MAIKIYFCFSCLNIYISNSTLYLMSFWKPRQFCIATIGKFYLLTINLQETDWRNLESHLSDANILKPFGLSNSNMFFFNYFFLDLVEYLNCLCDSQIRMLFFPIPGFSTALNHIWLYNLSLDGFEWLKSRIWSIELLSIFILFQVIQSLLIFLLHSLWSKSVFA